MCDDRGKSPVESAIEAIAMGAQISRWSRRLLLLDMLQSPTFPPILAEDVRRRIAQLEVEKGPGVEIEPLTDTERRRLVEGEWITDGEMDDGEG